jgi:glycosyltransferase involved in cell wall biosynthesis
MGQMMRSGKLRAVPKPREFEPAIAVILPCYNEGAVVAGVVDDFRRHLPAADIYVYDNNSADDTAAQAERAGAILRREPLQGKGYVVRRALAEIDADIYLLADGDGTYDASAAPDLVRRLWSERLDMVVGVRRDASKLAYRKGHRAGNRLFNGIVSWLFGKESEDMFSGYRALSRPFAKSFPSLATGFEIEAEITVHALQLELPTAGVPTLYGERDADSASKLRTYRDGFRILLSLLLLLKHHRPFLLFGALALAVAFLSLAIGLPTVVEFAKTGLVTRLPSAVLAASLMVIAVISLTAGVLLASVARIGWEQKRLAYLTVARMKRSAEP